MLYTNTISYKIVNASTIPIDKSIWTSIIKNYEMIGAQFSNTFIVLMVLNESINPLNSPEISEKIAFKIFCKLFKV